MVDNRSRLPEMLKRSQGDESEESNWTGWTWRNISASIPDRFRSPIEREGGREFFDALEGALIHLRIFRKRLEEALGREGMKSRLRGWNAIEDLLDICAVMLARYDDMTHWSEVEKTLTGFLEKRASQVELQRIRKTPLDTTPPFPSAMKSPGQSGLLEWLRGDRWKTLWSRPVHQHLVGDVVGEVEGHRDTFTFMAEVGQHFTWTDYVEQLRTVKELGIDRSFMISRLPLGGFRESMPEGMRDAFDARGKMTKVLEWDEALGQFTDAWPESDPWGVF
jgi:hypothetical protein